MYFGIKKPLFLVGLFFIVLVLPLTVLFLQNQQDPRSRASNGQTASVTPQVCKVVPADVSVVIDRSGSMNDRTSAGAGSTKIAGAKTAATNFVTLLAQNSQNRADLVTYASTSNLNVGFTSNFSSISSAINAISANGGTCIECGIKQANADIKANGRAGLKKVVVLLTDGRANFILGSSKEQNTTLAEQKALAAAIAGRAESGTIFFTIGLGNDVNTDFLEEIATKTGGKYYFPPTPEALNAIYAEISQIIAQGSVGGMLFNDLNGNSILDSGEQKLPNWSVEAVGATTRVSTTDANGNYFISGFCDGTYTVKPVLQSGWTQTFPGGGAGHTITIVNGSAIVGKDFGFSFATPTVTPSATPKPSPTSTPSATPTTVPQSLKFSVDLFLHGIGSSGDNANPTANSLSNKKPVHPNQTAILSVFDVNNNPVGTGSGTIVYSTASGSYKGDVVVEEPISTGAYTIKVRTPYHLFKLVPGIQSITAGQTYKVPSVHLIAGDSNTDNTLNILDYNLLLNCYSDLLPAVACN